MRAFAASSRTMPRRWPTRHGRLPSCWTRLGLYTMEVFQKGREEVIHRQQQEMLELSTPVVELWDGVLAVPLIGTLDSARTQVVMENLLQRIVDTGSGDRDHRHHRRADRRHARGAAPAEDGRRGPAHGRRLHHQRHPPADRPDDRPSRRGPAGRRHEGDACRRVRGRAATSRPRRPEDDVAARARKRMRARPIRIRKPSDGTHSDSEDGRQPAGQHPGRYARSAGDDAAGRSHAEDRGRRAPRGC